MPWEAELSFAQTRATAELARSGALADPSHPGNWLTLNHASKSNLCPDGSCCFPSYVPHASIPPGGSDGARICVTFDVVAA
jgi:hypothetical protein